MRAGSTGSVFRRGRASKQRQAPSRRMSLSPAASRSSSAGDTTAVAFGSTFSPKPDARMDELESPRSVVSLRRGSVHSDVAASGTHEKPLAVGRRSPLGSRRPRQDSPVERSLRCVLQHIVPEYSFRSSAQNACRSLISSFQVKLHVSPVVCDAFAAPHEAKTAHQSLLLTLRRCEKKLHR
jgi:hypothetical protein